LLSQEVPLLEPQQQALAESGHVEGLVVTVSQAHIYHLQCANHWSDKVCKRVSLFMRCQRWRGFETQICLPRVGILWDEEVGQGQAWWCVTIIIVT
jgi:hypothetical protein